MYTDIELAYGWDVPIVLRRTTSELKLTEVIWCRSSDDGYRGIAQTGTSFATLPLPNRLAVARELPLPDLGGRQLQRTPTRLYVHPSFGLIAKPLRCANVEERCAATTSSPSTTRSSKNQLRTDAGPPKTWGRQYRPPVNCHPLGRYHGRSSGPGCATQAQPARINIR